MKFKSNFDLMSLRLLDSRTLPMNDKPSRSAIADFNEMMHLTQIAGRWKLPTIFFIQIYIQPKLNEI